MKWLHETGVMDIPIMCPIAISPFAITVEQACGLLARGSKQPCQKQEEKGESKFPSCGRLRGGGYDLCLHLLYGDGDDLLGS